MKYTKSLLAKEKRQTTDAKFYGGLFEILNNEKTLEEFINLSLKKLDKINGKIHVIKRESEIIEVLTDEENEHKERISKSVVYKKIKETKKPYFYEDWNVGSDEVFAGFPLNLKGKFIGALIIDEKQEIKHWNEFFIVLHMLVFAFRYYSLIEKEKEMNIKDAVTGLYNERYFYNHFEVEEEKFIRFKTDMTLVLIELSNLADINDQYGYEVGEKVLKEVARVVKAQSRIIDMPAKVDREMFAVLLSGTGEFGGKALMTRVKLMLGTEVNIDGKIIEVNVRVGTSQFQNFHSRESLYSEVYGKIQNSK